MPSVKKEGWRVERTLAKAIADVRMLVFDFDGVFTDNAVWVMQDGRELVRCSRADGMGVSLLKKALPELRLFVLSTEVNPVVTARCQKLGLEAIQGVSDKGRRLESLAQEAGVALKHVAYVGNDINDYECLRAVGLPVVVADAHPSVGGLGRFRTMAPGGHGAIRELCDLFLRVRSPAAFSLPSAAISRKIVRAK